MSTKRTAGHPLWTVAPLAVAFFLYLFVGKEWLCVPTRDLAVGCWSIFAVAVGWGPPLQRLWFKRLGPAGSLVAAFLLNLLGMGAICIGLLWMGRFDPRVCFAVWAVAFLAVACVARREFCVSYKQWGVSLHRCVTATPLTRWVYLVWSLVLIHAFLYPFTAWDTQMRYALLGERFVARGAFHYPPLCGGDFLDLTMAEGYPPLMPALFGWFFLWTSSDLPSHVLSPLFLGMHLLALDLLAGRWYGRRWRFAGWLPLLYFLFPRVLYFAFLKQGYVDEPMTLLFTASLVFFFAKASDKWLMPVAVALAFWTKFSAPLLIGILGVAAWTTGRWRRWGSSFLGVLVGVPWMARNFILAGDPLYPLLYPLLGDKSQWLTDVLYQEAYGIWKVGRLTVLKELLFSIVVKDGFPWVALPGIWVWISRWRDKRNQALLAMFLVMVAAALIQRRFELRLVQFVLVPLCVASLQWVWGLSTNLRRRFGLFLCIWLGLSVSDPFQSDWLGLRWTYWSHLRSSHVVKRRAFLYPASLLWEGINRLPEGSVVLLPDSRHYYIEKSCFSLRNPLLREFVEGEDPKKRRAVLKELGITHVAIYSRDVPQEDYLVGVSRLWNLTDWPGVELVCNTRGGMLWRIP